MSGSRNADSPKPLWNSLEVAKVGASVLTPVAICVATLSFSYAARRSDEERAKADAVIARLDRFEARDVEITRSFAAYVHDDAICANQEGPLLLIAHATPKHAEFLRTSLVTRVTQCTGPGASPIREVTAATDVAAHESRMRYVDSFLADLAGPDRVAARDQLTELFQADQQLVGGRFAVALRESPNSYRVPLGIVVVLASTRGGWQDVDPLAAVFRMLGERADLTSDRTFASWYARAENARRPS